MLELNELLNEDPEDMLNHISDAIAELISVKHQAAVNPDIKDNAAYQRALQKLEAEIRNRVTVKPRQVEHQLKLHIEELNYKIERLTKVEGRGHKRTSADFDGFTQLETDEVLTKTTDLPAKLETRRLTQEISKLRKYHKRDAARILELEQKFKQTESQLKQVKDELDSKERDYMTRTVDTKRPRMALTSRTKDGDDVLAAKLLKEINFYRSRFDGKCLEVSALEGKLKVLNERLRSDSKTRTETKSMANSASPVRVIRSGTRKSSEGGLSGTMAGTVSGTLSKTIKLKPKNDGHLERSLSSDKLRKAYREVCRSRASVVVTYKTNAK